MRQCGAKFHVSIYLNEDTAPGGSTLVQYVDDLLLCSHTRESCKQDTRALLDFLAENGHKASKEKLQLVSQRVKYLGHVLTSEGRSLGPDRVASIQEMPKPETKQQLLSVLGMIGYCRPWIQDYAQRSQPLIDLTIGLGLTDRLTWTSEAEDGLIDLKQALMSAPALGVPDYRKPFVQYVDEKKGFMTSVLIQYHGERGKPDAYYSKRLDSVARALPLCLRAVAAAAEAVMASADLVQLHPLKLRVPHAVHAILTQVRTSHLTPARSVHYQNVLLTLANVTVERCSALNPATLLPTEADGEPHDCLQVIDCVCRPRPDLTDIPLEGGDILFVDGSSLRLEDGSPATSYAVVMQDGLLVDGGPLPRHWSAQAAELFALRQACKLAEGQKVTIYTDSRYAFGVCHDHGALWKQRGFRTSTGKPIQHHELVEQLLDALMLPKQVAIVKCQAHTKRTDEISQGNDLADQWAKSLAKNSTGFGNKVLLAKNVDKPGAENDLVLIQTGATEAELHGWKRSGAWSDREGVWRHSGTNKPYLPRSAYPGMAKAVHGLDHVSRDGMVAAVTRVWHAPGFATAAAQFCGKCMVCMKFNVGKGTPTDPAVTLSPQSPFDHLQMDFIELTPCRGYKYCLVIVDLFSRWVEAFPCRRPDALSVAKCLLKEVIPRWGIPSKITTDNGPAFIAEILAKLSHWMQIDLKHYCAYHPSSGGIVERANQTLKLKLVKISETTGLPWVDALPLALLFMRARTHRQTGLAPFEVLTGRPMRVLSPSRYVTLETVEGDLLTYLTGLRQAIGAAWDQVRANWRNPEGELP
ncbi:protein NYNRIN-like [Brienomyrus brachyistius]|uniref:protein NYNRIN-like n=1 Tax=Brienomyrus brachyistius TaxID=42636 RepID=UPI0020B1A9C7|nr:protein NYNRIN-like [Brienomyrus brachyistius]